MPEDRFDLLNHIYRIEQAQTVVRRKLDKYVDVAVFLDIVAQNRAKQAQLLDSPSIVESGGLLGIDRKMPKDEFGPQLNTKSFSRDVNTNALIDMVSDCPWELWASHSIDHPAWH